MVRKVKKNTEYRQSYKRGEARKIRESWEDHADYCMFRRRSEHVHTPLSWEDDLEEEDVDQSVERRRRGLPIHIYKHEKFNQAYRRRALEKELAKLGQLKISDNDDTGTSESSSSSEVRREDSPTTKSAKTQVNVKIKNKSTMTTPRKPGYRRPIPKPRPMSAPTGRPSREQRERQRQRWEMQSPPFAPYGFKDKERETAKKRTHNIRASSQVYPAALRAWRRREAEIERRQEARAEAPYRERRRRALFNDTSRRSPPPETEYRQAYAGHDPAFYTHNVRTRTDPRYVWRDLYTTY